jgi:hypothetical protein
VDAFAGDKDAPKTVDSDEESDSEDVQPVYSSRTQRIFAVLWEKITSLTFCLLFVVIFLTSGGTGMIMHFLIVLV